MEIKYVFTQKRREFGSPCRFVDVGPHLLVDIEPDPALYAQYVHHAASDKSTLCKSKMAAHEVNTETHPCQTRGICHEEGGWPADVDHRDEDQVARFKKKIEKDENYIATVRSMGEQVEALVMQNNSIDIYENYFSSEKLEVARGYLLLHEELKVLSVYRDYLANGNRMIAHVSWSPDCKRIVSSYSCPPEFEESKSCMDSYVWNIDNPVTPEQVLKPHVPLVCAEFWPWNNDWIVGGHENGQIALWDLTKGDSPVQLSSVAHSHLDSVRSICPMNTKNLSDFLSVSTDGHVMLWDTRNLYEPICNVRTGGDGEGRAFEHRHGLTCVEFDPTQPHRFMLGTDKGLVIICNRFIEATSDVIQSKHDTVFGPVLSLECNPFLPNIFMATNAWTIQIWSDDVSHSALLTLRAEESYFTDCAWCLTRPSVLFATKTTGEIEVWDILRKHHEPVHVLKVDDDMLTCVRPSPGTMKLACGSASGNIYILELPPYSMDTKFELDQISSMLESDRSREKFLEPKSREERLLEAKAAEKLAMAEKLKREAIDPSWAAEDKGDEIYAEMAELEFSTGFLNLEELEEEAEQLALKLHIEHEFGESEFLVELERAIIINSVMTEILMKVVADVESDNSKFPYLSVSIDDEFGEPEFLSELRKYFMQCMLFKKDNSTFPYISVSIDEEYGEQEFLNELRKIFLKTLFDSDNSKFPFRSLSIVEEFGEQAFLDELRELFKEKPLKEHIKTATIDDQAAQTKTIELLETEDKDDKEISEVIESETPDADKDTPDATEADKSGAESTKNIQDETEDVGTEVSDVEKAVDTAKGTENEGESEVIESQSSGKKEIDEAKDVDSQEKNVSEEEVESKVEIKDEDKSEVKAHKTKTENSTEDPSKHKDAASKVDETSEAIADSETKDETKTKDETIENDNTDDDEKNKSVIDDTVGQVDDENKDYEKETEDVKNVDSNTENKTEDKDETVVTDSKADDDK